MFGSGSSTTPYSTSRGFLANPLVALSRRETCIPYGLYVCMCRASSLASVGVCARCRRHGQKEHGWQAGMDGSAAWPSASAPPYPVYPSRGKKKKVQACGVHDIGKLERDGHRRDKPRTHRVYFGAMVQTRKRGYDVFCRLESPSCPCPFPPPAAVLVLCLECLDAVPFGLCVYLAHLRGVTARG